MRELKLLKFPENTSHEILTTTINKLVAEFGTDDEFCALDTMLVAMINHFSGCVGDDAYQINWELVKLRAVIWEFYVPNE